MDYKQNTAVWADSAVGSNPMHQRSSAIVWTAAKLTKSESQRGDHREVHRDRRGEAASDSQDQGEEKFLSGSQKAGGAIAVAATASGACATKYAAGMICKQPRSGRFQRFAPRFGDLCAQLSSNG